MICVLCGTINRPSKPHPCLSSTQSIDSSTTGVHVPVRHHPLPPLVLPRPRLELGVLGAKGPHDGTRVHDPDSHAEDEEVRHEEERGDPGVGLAVEPVLVQGEGDGDVEGGGHVKEALDDILLPLWVKLGKCWGLVRASISLSCVCMCNFKHVCTLRYGWKTIRASAVPPMMRKDASIVSRLLATF